MRNLGVRNLSGPNVYSHQPVLVMTLDLEDLAYRESCDIPGFVDRIRAALPGLDEHHCALARPGGFTERLREGTWFGHVVEHVAIELSQLAGIGVNRGKTVSGPQRGTFLVAVAYVSEAGMRYLLDVAVELVQSLVDGREFPIDERIAQARDVVEQHAFGPSTQAIVNAAERRGHPVASYRRSDQPGAAGLRHQVASGPSHYLRKHECYRGGYRFE